MSYIANRIQEKLLIRGQSEQAKVNEWKRSLKPTIYCGNNLFQELGGEPIEGRYLGHQGLYPGQSVANIGRNSNKPVIPGLPTSIPSGTQENKIVKYPADIVFLLDVSSSFGDDLPVWVSSFPSLLSQIQAQVKARFGLGSFSDQPLNDFGGPLDYPFRNDTGNILLDNNQGFLSQLNNLVILNGLDDPESQMYALLRASSATINPQTGYAQEFTEYEFEEENKLIVLITDATFHYNESSAPSWLRPGNTFYPTRSEVATNLYIGNIQLFCLIQNSSVISDYQSFMNDSYVYANPATGQSETFTLKGEVAALEPDSSDLIPVLTSLLRKTLIFTEYN